MKTNVVAFIGQEAARPLDSGRNVLDRKVLSEQFAFRNDLASLTQQSDAEATDINVIVKQVLRGMPVPQGIRMPTYGDFDGIFDFQSAMNVINDANAAFLALPADVRQRFGHDPQQFLEYVSAENEDGTLKNLEEMRKMGLAVPAPVPPPEPPPQKVEIVGGLPPGVPNVEVKK